MHAFIRSYQAESLDRQQGWSAKFAKHGKWDEEDGILEIANLTAHGDATGRGGKQGMGAMGNREVGVLAFGRQWDGGGGACAGGWELVHHLRHRRCWCSRALCTVQLFVAGFKGDDAGFAVRPTSRRSAAGCAAEWRARATLALPTVYVDFSGVARRGVVVLATHSHDLDVAGSLAGRCIRRGSPDLRVSLSMAASIPGRKFSSAAPGLVVTTVQGGRVAREELRHGPMETPQGTSLLLWAGAGVATTKRRGACGCKCSEQVLNARVRLRAGLHAEGRCAGPCVVRGSSV